MKTKIEGLSPGTRYYYRVIFGPDQARVRAGPTRTFATLDGAQVVISAGAAGIELLSAADRESCQTLDVAIDLCAVPPLGIGGIEVTDNAVERPRSGGGLTVCYGALGIGGSKMKIHKAALRRLFTRNDQVLDAEEIYNLGRDL